MNLPIDLQNTTLFTERLILRPWTWDDLDDLYAYASVDGVGQPAGWMPHRSREESREILAKFLSDGSIFAIERAADRRVIGSLGIHSTPWEKLPPEENPYPHLRTCEIGYVLAKPYWGQGLMPEAVRRVQAYLFCDCAADLVFVSHYDFNTQSRRVIEKCGFVHVGVEQHYARQIGQTYRCLRYALDRKTYLQNTTEP